MSIASYLSQLLNASGLLPVAKINATGTPSGTTFLRGDGSWNAAGGITSGTTVASTSGTSIDFTGIPATAKRITVMFNGVSLSGSATGLLRLGTSGGVVSTGYSGTLTYATTSASSTNQTTGIGFGFGISTDVMNGVMTLVNMTGNNWVASFVGTLANTPQVILSTSAIALAGALTTVRLTTSTGTDTFDAGSVNILYE